MVTRTRPVFKHLIKVRTPILRPLGELTRTGVQAGARTMTTALGSRKLFSETR